MTVDEMLAKLKKDVDALHDLLADPQPGLMSWSSLVAQKWKSIADLWSPPDSTQQNNEQ